MLECGMKEILLVGRCQNSAHRILLLRALTVNMPQVISWHFILISSLYPGLSSQVIHYSSTPGVVSFGFQGLSPTQASSPGSKTEVQTQTTKDVGGWVNFKTSLRSPGVLQASNSNCTWQ